MKNNIDVSIVFSLLAVRPEKSIFSVLLLGACVVCYVFTLQGETRFMMFIYVGGEYD